MGIKGLSKLLSEKSPGCLREQKMDNYFGRKIAIDASLTLYQFLIAVRQDGPGGQLQNKDGEVTSHLIGLFYRTINMMEQGIKPVYVFDGTPPLLKSHEFEKRHARIVKNAAEMEAAKARVADLVKKFDRIPGQAADAVLAARVAKDQETIVKCERRSVRITKKQNDGAMKLLRLMGVPVVEAPGEAEAQCAELCKGGKVYATATEDMDALTFGTPILVRHMTMSKERQKKLNIHEYNLKEALQELDYTMDQFLDLCILMGCDYTESIRGVGPKKAFTYLKKYGSIEKFLPELEKIKDGKGNTKFTVPKNFLYKEAAELFKKPDVISAEKCKLDWTEPKKDLLIKYMVEDKGFRLERIERGIRRIQASRKKGSQKRLESFFGPVTITKKRKLNNTKTKKLTKGKKKLKMRK